MKVTRKNAKNLFGQDSASDASAVSGGPGIEEFFSAGEKKAGGGATPSVNNNTTNVNFF